MNILKNKINVGLIALSAIMASGCDDSAFLKESPESSYAIENVFKSSNQVKQVVTSCYEKVRDIFCTSAPMQFSPRHFYMGNNGTDMFDVPNGRDAQNMNDYSKLATDYDIYKQVYNNFYNLVSQANLVYLLPKRSRGAPRLTRPRHWQKHIFSEHMLI